MLKDINKASVEAFKKLTNRYAEVTIEELKLGFKTIGYGSIHEGGVVMSKLTGFSSSCPLCEVSELCTDCIYSMDSKDTNETIQCVSYRNRVHYMNIFNAQTPFALYNYLQTKVVFMRSYLKEYKRRIFFYNLKQILTFNIIK